MSFEAMTACVNVVLPTGEKFLLLTLANYADRYGAHIFPAVGTMAQMTGMGKSTVRRLLDRLEAQQVLILVAPPHRYTPAEYRIDLVAVRRLPQIQDPERARYEHPDLQSARPGHHQSARSEQPGCPLRAARVPAPGTDPVSDPVSDPVVVPPPTPPTVDGWGTAEALAALYNRLAPAGHPLVDLAEPLSEGRQRKARAALKQRPEQTWWAEAFSEIGRSTFLREGSRERPEFRGDFDWFLQKGKADQVENYIKAHEGKYRDGRERGDGHRLLPERTRMNLAAADEAKRQVREELADEAETRL